MKWIKGPSKGGFWHLLGQIEHWSQTYDNGRTDRGTLYSAACGMNAWVEEYMQSTQSEGTPEGTICPKCERIAHLVKHGTPAEVTREY